MSEPEIKTIITPDREYWAAFLPIKEMEIQARVERVICWALINFGNDEDPDETVGQIRTGATINEVINVDEEDGFGDFVGYFDNRTDAEHGILEASARIENAEYEEGEDGEDLDDEDSDEDEDEDLDDDEEDE